MIFSLPGKIERRNRALGKKEFFNAKAQRLGEAKVERNLLRLCILAPLR
jgi:hypothetical protein